MIKQDELASPNSCLNRASMDEPVFVLLGRDAYAPAAIRAWAKDRVFFGKNLLSDPEIEEALALADRMEDYRANRQPRV